MHDTSATAERAELSAQTLRRLNHLLEELWQSNEFYREAWTAAGVKAGPLSHLCNLHAFPLIARSDFAANQQERPPWGTNHTRPIKDYVRFHSSSGTSGIPLGWLDDLEGWNWLIRNAQSAHELQGMRWGDVVLLCARFGGSLGPWLLYESAVRVGCKCMIVDPRPDPAKLEWLRYVDFDFLVGRPLELLSLADAFQSAGMETSSLNLRALISTGGPGNTKAARRDLSQRFGAPCLNRYGMTEAGTIAAAGIASGDDGDALAVLDDEFVVELVSPASGAVMEGEVATGELVLTTLGRVASPLVRYRTGDIVTMMGRRDCGWGARGIRLAGDIVRSASAYENK